MSNKSKVDLKRQRYFRINPDMKDFLNELVFEEIKKTAITRGAITRVILDLQKDPQVLEAAEKSEIKTDQFGLGRLIWAQDEQLSGVLSLMKKTGFSMTRAMNAILEAKRQITIGK